MIHILGVGSATPTTIINNQFLGELLGPEALRIAEDSGIVSRHSTLSAEYIRETHNDNVFDAKKRAIEKPTDLGFRAAEAALRHAGISAEQVGLVVAECATPDETTPAEAHRIAARLGRKIPAYDISTPIGVLPFHLDVISNWSTSRVPEYTLCVSTNCPTQAASYRTGSEAVYFGDGAAAMVISARHPGKLSLKHSLTERSGRSEAAWALDLTTHLEMKAEVEAALLEDTLHVGRALLSKAPAKSKFILTQFSKSLSDSLIKELKLDSAQVWNTYSTLGNALGSSPLLTLCSRFGELQRGDTIVVVSAPATTVRGGAILEVT